MGGEGWRVLQVGHVKMHMQKFMYVCPFLQPGLNLKSQPKP